MTESANAFHDFSQALKGVHTAGRLAVVAAVAALGFLMVINSSWKATPDSALYLELGESLHRGTGYVFNGEPHTYVPPGYPALVVLAASFMGEGFRTYRVLMALLGALTALAGYLFVRRLCGRDAALVVGGLFAVNHVLLLNSTFTTSDVPFALFVLIALNAALFASGDGRHAWAAIGLAGLLAGIPALMRVNGWGVPPAVAVFLFSSGAHQSAEKRVTIAVTFLAVATVPTLAWEGYKATFPPSLHEGTYLNVMAGRTLWTHVEIVAKAAWDYGHEVTYAMSAAAVKTGFLEFFCPVVALVGMVKAYGRGERLLVPLTVLQFAGLLLAPAGSRYVLALIPGLYLFFGLELLAIGNWLSLRLRNRGIGGPSPRTLLVGCFALFALVNVGQNAVTVLEARTALEVNGAESERDLPFFKAGRWLHGHGEGRVVLSMHPRIIHYVSGLPTAELVRSGVPEHETWIETQGQIRRLIEQAKPEFLFSDASNTTLYEPVMTALKGMNLGLEEITEVRVGNRFRLWRIVYP